MGQPAMGICLVEQNNLKFEPQTLIPILLTDGGDRLNTNGVYINLIGGAQ